MKSKQNKVPGFDEIIFENRNKEYGAYVIRKKYSLSAILSTIGGSALFTGLILLLAASKPEPLKAHKPDTIIVIVKTDSTIMDPNRYKQEPPKPVDIPKVNYQAPPLVVDTIPDTELLMKADMMIDTTANKPVDLKIEYYGDPDPVVNTEPDIVIIVDEMPEFPGGSAAMMEFIYKNIDYPEQAIDNGIEGKVTLRFAVWTDGSIKRIEVIKGVDPLLDKEAERVLTMMPKWKPGMHNGTPAAVWFTVPVKFELKKN